MKVCWIISNREDAAVIRQVLLKAKEKCGYIETRIFMGDDTNNFYNAWRGTFSVNITKKLLCAWHLDKSFRGSLQKHISSRTKQVDIYHQLRVLLHESEESSFKLRLQQFLSCTVMTQTCQILVSIRNMLSDWSSGHHASEWLQS